MDWLNTVLHFRLFEVIIACFLIAMLVALIIRFNLVKQIRELQSNDSWHFDRFRAIENKILRKRKCPKIIELAMSMQKLADEQNTIVIVVYNNVQLQAFPNGNHEDIINTFMSERKRE